MHGMNQGYLNARQSCSAESSAKQNYNRSVQIYLRIASDFEQTNPKNTTWHSIFKHYPNLKVIFFNETCYFKNTALANWYNIRKWQKIPHKSEHLSKFSSLVSLFRGGGIFIDMDTVVTLKPLNDPKWWNFFVKNSVTHSLTGLTHVTSSEIFHLEYGHHLSDEVILNLRGLKYNPFVPANHLFDNSIKKSIANICSNKRTYQRNYCKDIKLLNRRDIFVSPLGSTFWHPLKVALNQIIAQGNSKGNEKALQSMIEKTMEASAAPLMTWKSFEPKNSVDKTLYSILLRNICPFTVKYFSSLKSQIV
jgi:lactosylceramide 4-alpha-galactosyltransferase